MKKAILLLAIGFTAITANAQKMKEADVPAEVKTAFNKQFPGAKVEKWEKEDGNYEATFVMNKVEMSALMGTTGNIMETEAEIAVSALPKAVAEYCTKNCSGKKIKEASKITDAAGKIMYEAEVDDSDYVFDANGTFIKKVTEPKDEKDDDEKK